MKYTIGNSVNNNKFNRNYQTLKILNFNRSNITYMSKNKTKYLKKYRISQLSRSQKLPKTNPLAINLVHNLII